MSSSTVHNSAEDLTLTRAYMFLLNTNSDLKEKKKRCVLFSSVFFVVFILDGLPTYLCLAWNSLSRPGWTQNLRMYYVLLPFSRVLGFREFATMLAIFIFYFLETGFLCVSLTILELAL